MATQYTKRRDLSALSPVERRVDLKAQKRKYDQEHKDLAHFRFLKLKRNAKARGIGNELTFEQFAELTSQACNYCSGFSEGKSFTGLDRIDSDGSYSVENTVPCCWTCNFMKRDLAPATFLAHTFELNRNHFNRGISNTDLNRVVEIKGAF